MNVKIIGAILVVAGCGGLGFLMAWNYKRDISSLRRLIGALEYMACELEYRLTPLPELCRKTAELQSGCVKTVFVNLSRALDSQIAPDVSFCMSAALEKIPDMPKQTAAAFRCLGNSLGHFDLAGQLRGLESVRENCLMEVKELENNRSQRTRSYQTLGLCAGAALAILFI